MDFEKKIGAPAKCPKCTSKNITTYSAPEDAIDLSSDRNLGLRRMNLLESLKKTTNMIPDVNEVTRMYKEGEITKEEYDTMTWAKEFDRKQAEALEYIKASNARNVAIAIQIGQERELTQMYKERVITKEEYDIAIKTPMGKEELRPFGKLCQSSVT